MISDQPTTHGTCIALGNSGVLIRGESGTGKSSLALELIQQSQLAGEFSALVADDRVALSQVNGRVIAKCPKTISGLMELRGRGIIRVPNLKSVVLRLILDIVPREDIDRIPQDEDVFTKVLGIRLPRQLVPLHDLPQTLQLVRVALGNVALHNQRAFMHNIADFSCTALDPLGE